MKNAEGKAVYYYSVASSGEIFYLPYITILQCASGRQIRRGQKRNSIAEKGKNISLSPCLILICPNLAIATLSKPQMTKQPIASTDIFKIYFYILLIQIRMILLEMKQIVFMKETQQNTNFLQGNSYPGKNFSERPHQILSSFNHIKIQTMGGNASGALNTAGFSASINSNRLPNHEHITHAGVFNEKYFQVGDKSKELLSLHYGLGISNCDLFDLPKRNYFVSIFMKSSMDGEKRIRPINVCLVLDISGSMGGPLSYDMNNLEYEGTKKTRLELSQDAIWMLYKKLNPDDIFSLVVFHNQARTVLKSEFVKNLDSDGVKEMIYQKFESGGTTIRNGFDEAVKNIKNIRENNEISHYEHRIVMLTDVCDNSLQNQNILIEDISSQNNINTTIIGVSSEFQSHTCQKLTTVKGFNYFCAIEDKDLDTYLVDRFDYTFFPCVQDVQIRLQSKQIGKIEVYGSPDYRVKYQKQENCFIITKMKSGFPSQISYNKAKNLQTLGGLILVKFFPKSQLSLPKENLKLRLTYQDMDKKQYENQYDVKMNFEAEEYYSDNACRQGVRLFYYAQTMRTLLESMNEKLNDETKNMYLQKLKKLQDYCPPEKKEDLQKVIKIVQEKKQ